MTAFQRFFAALLLCLVAVHGEMVTPSSAAESNSSGTELRAADSSDASRVGRCNALAGRALGLVHRIDQGETDLCGNLVGLFTQFAPNCLGLLADGQLFLNHAVGEYRLACDVFKNICGEDPGDTVRPFPD